VDIGGRLFVLLQFLLPRSLLTALVYRLTRIRSQSFKNFLIRQFVKIYDVNTAEVAAAVPDDFATFNHFFIRELAATARPIDTATTAIVSPVDGTVSAIGSIDNDMVFQAKGRRYSLGDLLAADLQDVETYRNGRFATIYLAPYNYHRIHAPIDARLRAAHYVPGDLFSVNAATVRYIDGLFARNERLVCHFDGDLTPYVLNFVGALNVGSISTPWTGEIRPQKSGVVTDCALDQATHSLATGKGDLLGWFNMGSTVVLLFPADTAEWSAEIHPGSVLKMGQRIGTLSGNDID